MVRGTRYVAGQGITTVGRYATPLRRSLAWRQGATACPYCRQPMLEVETGTQAHVTRCVADPDASRMYVGQDVPAGCTVHRCIPCAQIFVSPPHGPSAAQGVPS